MVGGGIYGLGPVLAALLAGRRDLYALYVQEGLDLSRNKRKQQDNKGYEDGGNFGLQTMCLNINFCCS